LDSRLGEVFEHYLYPEKEEMLSDGTQITALFCV
jgi:hypothetical protein